MERVTSPLLISILKSHRNKLNALFAVHKQKYPALSEEIFSKSLGEFLPPILEKLTDKSPARLEKTVLHIYAQLLTLCAKNILGNPGKYPHFETTLKNLLHRFSFLLEAPEHAFFALLANALLHLSQLGTENLLLWQDILLRMPEIKDLPTFQNYGFICGWLSGMAHFRPAALLQLDLISPQAFSALFKIEPNLITKDKQRFILNQMVKNPWLTPEDILNPAPATSLLVHHIGNFSGLDGKFKAPPRVLNHQEELVVTDGESFFTLFADHYGQTLIKCPECAISTQSSGSPFGINQEGDLIYKNQPYSQRQKFLFPLSSTAFYANTFCFTSPSSYRVFLVGVKEAPALES